MGKTTVAVNLAWALAKQRKKVCLLDADLGLSNVDILLGLRPTVTLEHVLFDKARIEDAIIHLTDDIDIISGSSGVSRMVELSRERRMELVDEFAKLERYDFILVDNSPGISALVTSLCLSSRDILVVVNPEATSLTDSYALLKVLKENGLWWSPLILVNRSKNAQHARMIFERLRGAVRKFLKIDCVYIGFVLEDRAVGDAGSSQRPVVEMYPDAPSSRSFLSIGAWMAEHSLKKNRVVSPSRFWDQSVILAQQRPRFDGLSGKKQPDRPAPAPPAEKPAADAVTDEKIKKVTELIAEARRSRDLHTINSILMDAQSLLGAPPDETPVGGEQTPGPADEATASAEAHEAPQPEKRETPGSEQPYTRKILLICPDPAMLELLTDLTQTLGYEAVAWEEDTRVEPEKYRLVVVSWDRMDATAKATLEAWSDAPILLLAGFLRQSEPDYTLLSLVTAVVNKPFEIETLRATIEHLAA